MQFKLNRFVLTTQSKRTNKHKFEQGLIDIQVLDAIALLDAFIVAIDACTRFNCSLLS